MSFINGNDAALPFMTMGTVAKQLGYGGNETVAPVKKRSFEAAKINRLTSSWSTSSQSVDQDVYRSLRIMRARSRNLFYNDDYGKRFMAMCKGNVVGPAGISLQVRAKTAQGDKLDVFANRAIEEAFKNWAKKGTCDVSGRLSWQDLQNLAIESVARDGEVFIRKVKNFDNSFRFALQVIEADIVDENLNGTATNGNRIKMGVEIDDWERPVAYYLRTKHPGDTAMPGQYAIKDQTIRVPASEIVHIYMTIRPHQTRGIPWMHAAMLRLNMLGGYEQAELVAARIAASKMGFFTRNAEGEGYDGDDEDDDSLIMEAEPGTFEQLPAGVDFQSYDPSHPGGNFEPFTKAIIRGVASGLNVSYSGLSSDLRDVNFSSIRAGMLEERDGWMALQRWFIESLPDQIFTEWLDMAILTGNVNLPFSQRQRFNITYWQGRRWPWVDPLKDNQANLLSLQMGVASVDDIIQERGKDPEEVMQGIANSIERLNSYGLEDIVTNIYKSKGSQANGTSTGNNDEDDGGVEGKGS